MKRQFLLFLMVFFAFSFTLILFAPEKKEPREFKIEMGKEIISNQRNLSALSNFVKQGRLKGNLRSLRKDFVQADKSSHERFYQFYNGVRVFGAQIIVHEKEGKIYFINGNFYEDISIDTKPEITTSSAIEIALNDSGIKDLKTLREPELVVFLSKDGYLLAYQIILEKFGTRLVYFVDAKKGDIITNYNDIKYQPAIGIGTGTWGDKKKFSALFQNSAYYPDDRMRPARIYTLDMKNDYYYGYWTTTPNNVWNDGALVDAHVYSGWTYDYFYKVHERDGLDDSNMRIRVFVHYGYSYNNAFWDGDDIVFGDGDGVYYRNFSSALDVVAHELTHGVTQFSSNLIYWGESGALNEAFSDIIGVCAEFYFQRPGYGRLLADWWEGEDIFVNFGNAFRYFDDPSRKSFWGGPYPDHYSKRYYGSSYDNEFVHINSSIANHCFYLLANGGTNKTSGISVQGIGREKAEKIFYRGFVYYLWESSNFHHARLATIQAASDLYGSTSTERRRVEEAWTAVGVE